ncbi:MAG: hypothetical protein ACI9KE_002801 [Polyangiales bacterium]|jgi:hypothetical protein
MGTKIVGHGEEMKPLVEAFNAELRAADSPWGFYVDPVPVWIPKQEGQKVWREMFLAIENEKRCVGAYALKPQEWRIHGETQMVADWQGPISLGVIDPKYAVLGLRLLRDMLKKYPMLYSWGHGGSDEPIVKLLAKMGWLMHPTPFLFRICNGKNFLLQNGELRKDANRALAQDILAKSGLGNIAMGSLHAALRLKSKKRFSAEAEVVTEFGDWADTVWEKVSPRYDAIAVRDSATMNAMIPAVHKTLEWPSPTRLRIRKNGETLGWAVVMQEQKEGGRFGTLNVGQVADYLALPEDAGEVVHAAYEHLRESGADMVIANQSHAGWISAFEDKGFVSVAGRRLFCASPAFQAALEPWTQSQRGLFVSNFDGHGPMF